MEKKTVDFQLSENLEYTNKGDFEQTATIIMHAPNMDVFDEVSNLSQLVMGAISDAQKNRKDVSEEALERAKAQIDDDGIDAEGIKMLLLASQSVKFTKVAGEFNRLAPKVCEVATGINLTPGVMKKMSINDYTNLICTYIANFITPSLL